MRRRQTAEAVGRPQVFRVVQEVEDRAKVRRVCWKEGVQEGEEGEVAFVTDMIGFF